MRTSFNLVEKRWIQVQDYDGKIRLLSLKEVFESASQIKRLAGDTPAQDLSIFRLLLVIFWRANKDAPELTTVFGEDKSEWWEENYLDEQPAALGEPVELYLDKFFDRFDLLDSHRPFMQVASLERPDGERPQGLEKLIPDSESCYFTMRAGPGSSRLGFAEAARWLVALHAWNYAGIKTGVVGDQRVKGNRSYPIGTGWSGASGGVIVHGSTLAKSFLLNTVPTQVFDDRMSDDVPVWERENIDGPGTHGRTMAFGPCEMLTWQSRRVLLYFDDVSVWGLLLTNGDKPEIRNQFTDPMTGYRYSTAQSTKVAPVHFPKKHNETRTLWRGVESLLIREGASTERTDKQPETVKWLHEMSDLLTEDTESEIQLELVGMVYGPQESSIQATVHEEIPMRLATLADKDYTTAQTLISTTQRTLEAAILLGQLSGNLKQAAGGNYEFNAEAMEGLLNFLNEPFKSWTADFTPEVDQEEYRKRWFEFVYDALIQHGQILVRGAGTPALIGHNDNEGTLRSAATAWSLFEYKARTLLTNDTREEASKTSEKFKSEETRVEEL